MYFVLVPSSEYKKIVCQAFSLSLCLSVCVCAPLSLSLSLSLCLCFCEFCLLSLVSRYSLSLFVSLSLFASQKFLIQRRHSKSKGQQQLCLLSFIRETRHFALLSMDVCVCASLSLECGIDHTNTF